MLSCFSIPPQSVHCRSQTAPPQAVAPFGVPYKLLYSLSGPPMTAPTTHLISFWHKQGDALRPHIFTISHDHPPIGGFHMAEPYFTLRKQYFTAHGRNFTAGVSPLLSRLRAVHVRIFAVQAHQLIVRAKAAHKPVFKAKYPVRLHNGRNPLAYQKHAHAPRGFAYAA